VFRCLRFSAFSTVSACIALSAFAVCLAFTFFICALLRWMRYGGRGAAAPAMSGGRLAGRERKVVVALGIVEATSIYGLIVLGVPADPRYAFNFSASVSAGVFFGGWAATTSILCLGDRQLRLWNLLVRGAAVFLALSVLSAVLQHALMAYILGLWVVVCGLESVLCRAGVALLMYGAAVAVIQAARLVEGAIATGRCYRS